MKANAKQNNIIHNIILPISICNIIHNCLYYKLKYLNPNKVIYLKIDLHLRFLHILTTLKQIQSNLPIATYT